MTFVVRWGIATLAFLLVVWIDIRYGHATALVVLLALLLFIAVYGGHGRRRSASGDADAPSDEGDDVAPHGESPTDADGDDERGEDDGASEERRDG